MIDKARIGSTSTGHKTEKCWRKTKSVGHPKGRKRYWFFVQLVKKYILKNDIGAEDVIGSRVGVSSS